MGSSCGLISGECLYMCYSMTILCITYLPVCVCIFLFDSVWLLEPHFCPECGWLLYIYVCFVESELVHFEFLCFEFLSFSVPCHLFVINNL